MSEVGPAGAQVQRGGEYPSPASVRTSVQIPLRMASDCTTIADVFSFDELIDDREHLLFGLGQWQRALVRSSDGGEAPLVRLHSECLTGDVFGSERCDCGPQLRESIERVADDGGFLLYLRQEGRNIGLYAKLEAYALQDSGLNTFEANLALGRGEDERDYRSAVQMLVALGVKRIRLLSNNPDKASQLEHYGLVVEQNVPTGVYETPSNRDYLAAKRDHSSHTLELQALMGDVDRAVA